MADRLRGDRSTARWGKHTADVRLRVSVPPGTTDRFVKQVAPTIEDLTEPGRADRRAHRRVPDRRVGRRSADYHVGLTVPAQAVGDEMLAGRMSVVVGGDVVANSLVRATWTDDRGTSTRINQRVAHYTGQEEMASAIAERSRRPCGRRHGDRLDAARASRATGRGERPRGDARVAAQGRSTSTTPDRHRRVEAKRGQSPTRWPSTRAPPRPSGSVRADEPAGPSDLPPDGTEIIRSRCGCDGQ